MLVHFSCLLKTTNLGISLKLILLNLLLFVPILQRVFSVGELNVTQIGWIYLLALIPTALIQMGNQRVGKLLLRRKSTLLNY